MPGIVDNPARPSMRIDTHAATPGRVSMHTRAQGGGRDRPRGRPEPALGQRAYPGKY